MTIPIKNNIEVEKLMLAITSHHQIFTVDGSKLKHQNLPSTTPEINAHSEAMKSMMVDPEMC